MKGLRRRDLTARLKLPLTASTRSSPNNDKLFSSSSKLQGKDNVTAITIFIRQNILKPSVLLKSLVIFFIYAVCMDIHNTRSIRDPCEVAQQSLEEAKKVSSRSNKNDQQQQQQHPTIIPKIIHQQWKDDKVPEAFMRWKNKWLDLFPEPEYKHMLWTDTNGRELIEKNYPWFLDTYDGYEHNINRADAARYFILYHYGGIYADLDYEPMTNFYEYLPSTQVGMVESPYYWNEKTQNCLMSSPQKNLFWEDLFQELMKNAKQKEVLEATGPLLLDQAMSTSSHATYILPCENFQRVPLGEYGETMINTIFIREAMFRLVPISKHCGYYSEPRCHFGKHHNANSYRTHFGNVL